MLKHFILILSLITFKIGTLYSKDIREFEVGTNIKNIPEETIVTYQTQALEQTVLQAREFFGEA